MKVWAIIGNGMKYKCGDKKKTINNNTHSTVVVMVCDEPGEALVEGAG